MSTFPFLITPHSAATTLRGKSFSMDASHPLFSNFVAALRSKDTLAIENLMDNQDQMDKLRKQLAKSTGVIVKDRSVFYNGEPIHSSLTDHIVKMLEAGENVDPMKKFLTNVMLNPSQEATMELWEWVASGDFTITPDGYFLAYKKVTKDFKDIYTKTIDHSPGTTPKMPRSMVDSNRSNTCSIGLHFCSLNYLPRYAGSYEEKVVIVKIHPADVIAIPNDYNNQKGRACKYEVVCEYGTAGDVQKKELFTKPVMRPGDMPKDKLGNKIKKVGSVKVKSLPKDTAKPNKGESFYDKNSNLYKVWDGKRWRTRKTDPKAK